MTMNTGESRGSRTRFSLGSLFLAMTAIGGCLAALRFKSRLLDANWWIDYARSVVEPLPMSSEILLVTLQVVTLVIASLSLFFWRKPSLLWVYAVGHTLWLGILVMGISFQDQLHQVHWISEACLGVFFFEPTCGLVFIGMALLQSLFQRNVARVATLALISLLSLVAELCVSLALCAFAAALGAAIAMSR